MRAPAVTASTSPLAQALRKVNPVLQGWAAYFRYGASKKTFAYLGWYAWWRMIGWIRRKHKNLHNRSAPGDDSRLHAFQRGLRLLADQEQYDRGPRPDLDHVFTQRLVAEGGGRSRRRFPGRRRHRPAGPPKR